MEITVKTPMDIVSEIIEKIYWKPTDYGLVPRSVLTDVKSLLHETSQSKKSRERLQKRLDAEDGRKNTLKISSGMSGGPDFESIFRREEFINFQLDNIFLSLPSSIRKAFLTNLTERTDASEIYYLNIKPEAKEKPIIGYPDQVFYGNDGTLWLIEIKAETGATYSEQQYRKYLNLADYCRKHTWFKRPIENIHICTVVPDLQEKYFHKSEEWMDDDFRPKALPERVNYFALTWDDYSMAIESLKNFFKNDPYVKHWGDLLDLAKETIEKTKVAS